MHNKHKSLASRKLCSSGNRLTTKNTIISKYVLQKVFIAGNKEVEHGLLGKGGPGPEDREIVGGGMAKF